MSAIKKWAKFGIKAAIVAEIGCFVASYYCYTKIRDEEESRFKLATGLLSVFLYVLFL